MRRFLVSTAVLALLSVSAQADPGGGKGGGERKGGGDQVSHGNADAGPATGNGGGKAQGQGRGKSANHDSGPAMREMRNEVRGNSGKGDGMRTERSNGAARAVPGRGNDNRGASFDDKHSARVVNGTIDNRGRAPAAWNMGSRLVDGCPPGLAKKNNGCLPPGLAKKTLRYNDSDWYRWRGLEVGDYRYNDGYLLRMNGGSVIGYVPLLGGALGLGNMWPTSVNSGALPDYYQDYYGLGDPGGYRYYGDTIYRVDPQTSTISSIAALLTGDQFAVGQPFPDGYDVYNVPYDYRDRYADGPDSTYRYSDGYVYQVDPTTQLIQAAIKLLL